MTDGTNGATSGQEPTPRTNVLSGRASYSPQAGDAGADERSGTDGGAHSPNAQANAQPDMTLEDALAALKAARTEAVENRRKAKELDDLRKAEEEAKLSETEKLQKQRDEALAERDKAIAQSQERMVRAEVRIAAREMGLNAELALKLIDMAAIVVDEATGDPTNIEELLKQAIERYGLAAAPTNPSAASPSAPGQQQAQQPRTGATNPPRGGQVVGANGTFSVNEIPSVLDSRLWRRG